MKTCCCIGHTPQGFLWDHNDKECEAHKEYLRILKYVVEKHIKNGFDRFIVGSDIGSDLDFAQTLIQLIVDKYPYVRLKMETPKQPPHDRIDQSDAVIAVWNGKEKGEPFRSIKYAEKQKKPIDFIGLPPLNQTDLHKNADFYIEFPFSLKDKKKKDDEWQKIKERLRLPENI